jgi:penicillin-binding protein 1A
MGFNRKRKLVYGLLTLSFILFVSPFFVWWGVKVGLFGAIPDSTEIQSIRNNQASEIYFSNGDLLGKYYLYDRTSVDYNYLPTHVVNALIATEDARFFEHHGIDYRSLLRVFFKTIILQDNSAGGGSTITQQLAKNLFPRQDYGLLSIPVNKFREMAIAEQLEEIYSKNEIIALYLNTVPFGDHVFGVESASRRFYNASVNDLTIDQAAVLIGMLKGNYAYNPRVFPERSLNRRNVVLSQMNKYGYLTELELHAYQDLPIELDYTKMTLHEGPAPYFREQMRMQLLEWCKSHFKADGSPYNLYTDGLKIYTTLDAGMQQAAELAMQRHMAALQTAFEKEWGNNAPWLRDKSLIEHAVKQTPIYLSLLKKGLTEKEISDSLHKERTMELFEWAGDKEVKASVYDSVRHYLKFLQTGFVAMDPKTGAVRAWVGGINHQYFEYDHVNVNTKRQVGSTFKPFVFASALESGVKPCDYFSSKQITYENMENWAPENAEAETHNFYTMKGALTHSVNTVSVKVLEETGIASAVKLARDLNISSTLPEVPSLALGTADISTIELAGAYAAFLNHGIPVAPQMLLRVEDGEGKVLEEFVADEQQAAMSENTSKIMLDMMQAVIKDGTGKRLHSSYNLTNALAGKTGTTQSNRDGWFVGMLPNLVTVTWVGANNPKIYFKSTILGQGASSALPIFAFFLEKLNKDSHYNGITRERFAAPSGDLLYLLDCEPYKEKEGFIKGLLTRKEQEVRDFGEEKKKGFLSKIKSIFKKKEN